MKIRQGDIVLVNLEQVVGSEQGRMLPALVIQNNVGNELSPTTIVAPITTKVFSKEFPTNVFVAASSSRLKSDSTVLLNQIRTIDQTRIVRKVSVLNGALMAKVDMAIRVSLVL